MLHWNFFALRGKQEKMAIPKQMPMYLWVLSSASKFLPSRGISAV
jgi:hypothetical protein